MSQRVGLNTIYASLCVYLLLGIIWSILYVLAYLHTPEAFSNLHGTRGELVYYSFVTLTTLGYGDIAPLTALARTLAYMEAVAGQFYLAVLVAGLVGAYVSQAASTKSEAPQTPGKA